MSDFDFNENDLRDIERERDLPPDEMDDHGESEDHGEEEEEEGASHG